MSSEQVKSKDWCPICLLQNKAQNVLLNRPGQYYSSCAAGHQFQDTVHQGFRGAHGRECAHSRD